MSKPQERLKLLGKRLRKTMWHWPILAAVALFSRRLGRPVSGEPVPADSARIPI